MSSAPEPGTASANAPRVLLHALPVLQMGEHATRVAAAAHSAAQPAPMVAGALLGTAAEGGVLEVHMALELVLVDGCLPAGLLKDRLSQAQAVYPALTQVGWYSAPVAPAISSAEQSLVSAGRGQGQDQDQGPRPTQEVFIRFGRDAGGRDAASTDLPIAVFTALDLQPLPSENVSIVAAGAERIAVDGAAHARPPPPPVAPGELPQIQADAPDENLTSRLDASHAALGQLGQRVEALAAYVRRLSTLPGAAAAFDGEPLAHVQPDLPHDLLRAIATVASSLPESHPPSPASPPSSTSVPVPTLANRSEEDWLSPSALSRELQAEEADVLLATQLAQLTQGWGELNEWIGKFELARQTEPATLEHMPPLQGPSASAIATTQPT